MRKFAQVSPRFWCGATGRDIRGLGHEAQVVALYLMTCPSSVMTGLFYLPVGLMAHEIGSTFEGASKALARVCNTGFCAYDELAEVVFLPEMANWQIGDSLKAADKRVKGVENALLPYLSHEFSKRFWDKYAEAFQLDAALEPRGFEGACKELRSKEKDKEKDKEKENDHSATASVLAVSVVEALNQLTGRNFEADGKDIAKNSLVLVRQGFTPEQAVDVVRAKHAEWGSDQNMAKQLKPSVLLRPSNFAKYLAEDVDTGTPQASVGGLVPKLKLANLLGGDDSEYPWD